MCVDQENVVPSTDGAEHPRRTVKRAANHFTVNAHLHQLEAQVAERVVAQQQRRAQTGVVVDVTDILAPTDTAAQSTDIVERDQITVAVDVTTHLVIAIKWEDAMGYHLDN